MLISLLVTEANGATLRAVMLTTWCTLAAPADAGVQAVAVALNATTVSVDEVTDVLEDRSYTGAAPNPEVDGATHVVEPTVDSGACIPRLNTTVGDPDG